jgi:hypothetical protein
VRTTTLGRGSHRQVQINSAKRNRRAPVSGGGGRSSLGETRLAVAQSVCGALPLRDVVGDHAGRLHRGLAELRIAGNLALNALAFGMQEVAQALEFGNQLLDFRQRSTGDTLDQ